MNVVAGKTEFHYSIPGVGAVCKTAWLLAAGFGARNNRVDNLEKEIRQGLLHLPGATSSKFVSSNTLYAEAFCTAYILANSQRSPCTNDL